MAQPKVKDKIAIVGAGLSGAVFAQQLRGYGFENLKVYEERDHVAGNIYTERDADTGAMEHVYGPHIFHTDDSAVWDYVNRFTVFIPYIQRTKAISRGEVFSFPINLHTLGQLYRRPLSPIDAQDLIQRERIRSIDIGGQPMNFEEAALSAVGPRIYESFFAGYTYKQWGIEPEKLPASIFRRVPIRFTFDDSAFTDKYQGIPSEGYTTMVNRMLCGVPTYLGRRFRRGDRYEFDWVICTGPIDQWFGYQHGRLPYRTLDFERIRSKYDIQGCSVMNACDRLTGWTRCTEHKFFTPWDTDIRGSIATLEFPRDAKGDDTLFYPLHYNEETKQLATYKQLAAEEERVVFLGRLGTYRYLNMDQCVEEAIVAARKFVNQA